MAFQLKRKRPRVFGRIRWWRDRARRRKETFESAWSAGLVRANVGDLTPLQSLAQDAADSIGHKVRWEVVPLDEDWGTDLRTCLLGTETDLWLGCDTFSCTAGDGWVMEHWDYSDPQAMVGELAARLRRLFASSPG